MNITTEFTIASHLKVNHIANAHIDDTQKALVLLFELLLVEDLNGKNTVLVHLSIIHKHPVSVGFHRKSS